MVLSQMLIRPFDIIVSFISSEVCASETMLPFFCPFYQNYRNINVPFARSYLPLDQLTATLNGWLRDLPVKKYCSIWRKNFTGFSFPINGMCSSRSILLVEKLHCSISREKFSPVFPKIETAISLNFEQKKNPTVQRCVVSSRGSPGVWTGPFSIFVWNSQAIRKKKYFAVESFGSLRVRKNIHVHTHLTGKNFQFGTVSRQMKWTWQNFPGLFYH